MQPLAISFTLLASALSAFAQMSDAAAAAELVAKLITSPTQVGRFALLQDTDVSQIIHDRIVLLIQL